MSCSKTHIIKTGWDDPCPLCAIEAERDRYREALESARKTIAWCAEHHQPINGLAFAALDYIDRVLAPNDTTGAGES